MPKARFARRRACFVLAVVFLMSIPIGAVGTASGVSSRGSSNLSASKWSDYFVARVGRTCEFGATYSNGGTTLTLTVRQRIVARRHVPAGIEFRMVEVERVVETTSSSASGATGTTNSSKTVVSETYLLARNGTFAVVPVTRSGGGLKIGYEGFEVFPTVAALRSGATYRGSLEMTMAGSTPQTEKLLHKGVLLPGKQDLIATFDYTSRRVQAPSVLVTPAGSFRHVLAVRTALTLGSVENVTAASRVKVEAVFKKLESSLEVRDYYAPKMGLVESGVSAFSAKLESCSG
jgi:hypothetical protein